MKSVVIILLLTIFGCILVSSQFTEEEIQQTLDRINSVRRNADPTGSNLREIMWSDCLANIAAEYLIECPNFGEQNQNRETKARGEGCVAPAVSVGETRFNGASGGDNPVDVWASESSIYDFATNICQTDGDCNNYLQLVNAETFVVGCAKLDEVENCGREGESTVCNYAFAPDGNAPYMAGEACADCEGEFSGCNEGLCVRTPATTVITTNPPATTVTTTNPPATTVITTSTPATTAITKTNAPNCPGPKDHNRHNHRQHPDHHHGHNHGHKHEHKHGHKRDQKRGRNSHDHDKCVKKHDYNSAEISLGNFEEDGYNNNAMNNRVMILLLIGSIISTLLSIL